MGGAPWCWAAPVTSFPQSTTTHGTGRVRARKRMNWCPSIQTTQCTQTSQESTTASQKMKKIKVCLIPSICLNVSEFQGLITVCVIAQETSGKFISDHVFWLSVRTSCVCERDISRRSWGSFFKMPWGNPFIFGTNTQLDSRSNWFDLVAKGQRSRSQLPHKTRFLATWKSYYKTAFREIPQLSMRTQRCELIRYQRSKVTVSSSESWLVEVNNCSTVFLVQSVINLCTLNKVEINSTGSQLSVYMMLSLF